MMSVLKRLLLLAAVCLVLYLAFWPVAIEPVAWRSPANPGYVDPHAANERLRPLVPIDLAPHAGPEDGAFGPDGALYVGTEGGRVLRIAPTNRVSVFAEPGGRPLGVEFDANGRLLVANAVLGLQGIAADGSVELLLDSVDGTPIRYANDVAVSADGRVFLSDSSMRFGPAAAGGTLAASLADIMEHGGTGRVIEYEPATGRARVFADGLVFANGLAVSEEQRWLLVAETGRYRIRRYPLAGGAPETVLDNLPGFPDNLSNGLQGRFWVGLVAPRNALLDRLAERPWLRKVVQRLPAAARPEPAPYSHVVAFTGDGQVLMDLQDTGERLPMLTGVLESRDALYLTTLAGPRLGRLDKDDLPPR